ncbi:DUF397 domain-containing protein [Streptomyces sp. NPDC002667]|uniref:DUF397 domain-containing protein n=1 Tax=Streptomyces sp. NPDC002667 TaxID=3364657 RepID=UPI00367F0732
MIHVTSPEDPSGLIWFKSSYSSSSEAGDCVEIAPTPAAIHIRDSKDPGGARLAMDPAAWTAFVASL